jgi:LemA protein
MNPFLILAVVVLFAAWTGTLLTHLLLVRRRVQELRVASERLLVQRARLVLSFVQALRAVMPEEQAALDQLTAACEGAQSLAPTAVLPVRAAAEDAVTMEVGRVLSLVERYPTASGDPDVRRLQDDLATIENRFAFTRQLYNGAVRRYNGAQETFPATLLGGFFGHRPAEYLEAEPTPDAVPLGAPSAKS